MPASDDTEKRRSVPRKIEKGTKVSLSVKVGEGQHEIVEGIVVSMMPAGEARRRNLVKSKTKNRSTGTVLIVEVEVDGRKRQVPVHKSLVKLVE